METGGGRQERDPYWKTWGLQERNAEFPQDAVSHPSSDRAKKTMDGNSATPWTALLMPCGVDKPQ